ncbi:MAG: hypothetical protein IRZ16_00520 [Myxococcaceae bacterium]|nr:hypothetical protein [Myxococcaceae bacterium]
MSPRRSLRGAVLVSAIALWSGALRVAEAGWSAPVDVGGTVNDVQAWDGGQVTAASSQGGFEVLPGGAIARSLTGFTAASAYLDASGCLITMDRSGNFQATPCSPPPGINFSFSFAKRLRVAPGGYGYTCSGDTASGVEVALSPSPGSAAWSVSNVIGASGCGAVSAATFSGDSYGVVGLAGTSTLRVYRNGSVDSSGHPPASPPSAPLDTALTGDVTTGLRAFVIDPVGAMYVSPLDGGFADFVPVPPPVAGATFRAVSVYQSATERFGMAVVDLPDGGSELFSAVPDPSPGSFGLQWRPSTAPPAGLAGRINLLSCSQTNACAVATTAADVSNVAVYGNTQPPGVLMTSATLAPGAQQSFAAPADPDGDAIWVTATASPGISAEVDGGTIVITAPGGPQCDGGVPYTVQFTSSDGKAGHEVTSQIDLTVLRDTPPVLPVVTPAEVTMNAGDPPQMVTAALAPGECANFGLSWQPPLSTASGVTVTPSADGTSATIAVPPNQCAPVTEVFQVITSSTTYGNSPPATLTVNVNGFGAPLVPFVDRVETQLAGTSAQYGALQTHACNDGGTPLVDVDTRWWLDGGVPASVSITPPLPPGGAVTDTVTVDSTDPCHDGVLEFVARNESGGLTSAEGTLTIQLQKNLDPLDSGTFTLTPTGDGFEGTSTFEGVNCVAERQLTAAYILRLGDTELDRKVFPVPGPWSVTPQTSCAPGTVLTIHAEITGDESIRSNELTVIPHVGQPALGALETEGLRARCEAESVSVIAEGAVRHTPGADECLGQQVRWSAPDAPGTTFTPAAGNDVRAQVQADTWDELVDRDLAVQAVATAEGAATAPGTVTAHVVPDAPFVTAHLDTDVPIAEEGVRVGLVATLENTSACPVEGARWIVTMEGLLPFGELASVAGVRAPALVEGNTITVESIALPPHQPVRIVVSARAALLGRPTAWGQVVLGDETPEAISEVARLGEGVPETGCGCSAVDVPGVIAAAFALSAWGARRRLRVRRRSADPS